MNVIITGASGFIGSKIFVEFIHRGYSVKGIVRSKFNLPAYDSFIEIGNSDTETNWNGILHEKDIVIHAAARVHIMQDKAIDPLGENRRTNVDSTLHLARQAAEIGVKRFIFLSSIKVNGETTTLGNPFQAEDMPNPIDPYGVSKKEAEDGLFQISKTSGMEVVVIRPPLVYGPGVKANFAAMMKWLKRGIPLPLGAVNNRRSLVALDNLVDLIAVCVENPAAANQIFLAGDGEDLSTTELLLRLGKALGRPARLFPVPISILNIAATLAGNRSITQRLCGTLQVDISKAKSLLGWNPPISVDEALYRTAMNFLKHDNV